MPTVAESLYFRCDRLSATLTVAACREQREKWAHTRKKSYAAVKTYGAANFPAPLLCKGCPLAEQLEAGELATWDRQTYLARLGRGEVELPPKRTIGELPVDSPMAAIPDDAQEGARQARAKGLVEARSEARSEARLEAEAAREEPVAAETPQPAAGTRRRKGRPRIKTALILDCLRRLGPSRLGVIVTETGIRMDNCSSMLSRLVHAGEVVRGGARKQYIFALPQDGDGLLLEASAAEKVRASMLQGKALTVAELREATGLNAKQVSNALVCLGKSGLVRAVPPHWELIPTWEERSGRNGQSSEASPAAVEDPREILRLWLITRGDDAGLALLEKIA